MADRPILFSRRAAKRLEELADYVYERSGSADTAYHFVLKLQTYIETTLQTFPEAGRKADEYGDGVRKLVYERFSILYRIQENAIEVLTLYRENLP